MNDRDKYLKYKKKYMDAKQNIQKQNRISQSGGTAGTPFPLEDEIHFWGRQMLEHMLFLFLGLEDYDYAFKNRSFKIHNDWNNFMKTCFWNRGIVPKSDLIVLGESDLKKLDKIDMSTLEQLLIETEKFQKDLLSVLGTGKWMGWIFPSLVEHMQKETDYFKRKINGPDFTASEEVKFINQHHGEEIGTTAQLIDPAPENQPLIEKARSYATKTMKNWSADDLRILQGMDVGEQATILRLSSKYSNELVEFARETGQKIKANQLKSIINPILAAHVEREYMRFSITIIFYQLQDPIVRETIKVELVKFAENLGLGDRIRQLGDAIKPYGQQIKSGIVSATDTVKPYVDNVTQRAKTYADSTSQQVKPYIDSLTQQAKPYVQSAKSYIDTAVQKTKPYIDTATQRAQEYANKIKSSAQNTGRDLSQEAKNTLTDLGDKVKETGSQLWDKIKALFGNTSTSVTS